MDYIREVKKGFCILSVAYLVIGIVLLIWPDISVKTFCYVFGIAMIIFGGAHLIMYFTKDRLHSVMEQDLVIGVVTAATGFYILIKMQYMLEIIPFALGIVALLGSIVKVQNALDLKRLGSKKWFLMLIWALILFGLGTMMIINPFDGNQKIIVILIGISLLFDGFGNLVGIFWIGFSLKSLKKVYAQERHMDQYEAKGNAPKHTFKKKPVLDTTIKEATDEVVVEEDKELPVVYTDELQDED